MSENIKAKEFTEVIGPIKRDMVILYNQLNISEQEVDELIKNGEYNSSNRIIVTTKKHYDFMKGKVN